jgi:hypothetical protein
MRSRETWNTSTVQPRHPEQENAVTENWSTDVPRYVGNPDANTFAGIVRYCGIALKTRDASLVSFNNTEEVKRVRDHLLKKKVGLANPEAKLEAAIKALCLKR